MPAESENRESTGTAETDEPRYESDEAEDPGHDRAEVREKVVAAEVFGIHG
jgi:hypothetical protein